MQLATVNGRTQLGIPYWGSSKMAKVEFLTREERESLFRRHDMDFVSVRTDEPYVSAIVTFFRARERRFDRRGRQDRRGR